MLGSRGRLHIDGLSLLRRRVFPALSVVLATLSLLGLRGVAGLYLSPAVAFALGVAALAMAPRPSHNGRDLTVSGEIGFALALVACGAAVVAVLATGHT